MKIFVVEDERQLCDDIAEDLELERYTVERCYDGLEAWERILVESYDLVILDLNLPGMDGLDILRAVRREKPEQRVLILSARSTLADRVAGLDLGADDYLTKPFALEELEARVRALLRRDFASRDTALVVGPLTLDTQRREISAEGLPLSLTRKEFGRSISCSGRGRRSARRSFWSTSGRPTPTPSATRCGCTSPPCGKSCAPPWAMTPS